MADDLRYRIADAIAYHPGNRGGTLEQREQVSRLLADAVLKELQPELERAEITGSTSDGFHTFDELYHHRTLLFMLLQPHIEAYRCPVWKSRLHEDGTMFDGFFIAGVSTPDGEATYHCLDRYWDLFEVPELGRAPAFDGHTPEDTLKRLFAAMTGGQKLEVKP